MIISNININPSILPSASSLLYGLNFQNFNTEITNPPPKVRENKEENGLIQISSNVDNQSFGKKAEEFHALKMEKEKEISQIRNQIFVLQQNIQAISPETGIVLVQHIKYLASQLQVEVDFLNAIQQEFRKIIQGQHISQEFYVNKARQNSQRPKELPNPFSSKDQKPDAASITVEILRNGDQTNSLVLGLEKVKLIAINLFIAQKQNLAKNIQKEQKPIEEEGLIEKAQNNENFKIEELNFQEINIKDQKSQDPEAENKDQKAEQQNEKAKPIIDSTKTIEDNLEKANKRFSKLSIAMEYLNQQLIQAEQS